MSRIVTFVPACALAFIFCLPGHAQDSPSLGDLARQAQKEKEKDKASKPAKVYTNDDVATCSTGSSAATGGGSFGPAKTGAPSAVSGGGSAAANGPSVDSQLVNLASMLDQVDSTDRATLVKNVLGDHDTNFPGRASWEQRLFAAKQTYVSQGRALLQRLNQIQASAEQMKGVQDPNDPRVKSLNATLQQLVQSAQQTGAAFQAVIMEGKDLAAQAAAH